LNVPIIALSQLSRAVETRGGEKRPMLSDLRESGAIEQDADMVMFIYRPAYYGIEEDDDGLPTDDLAELILAKHRNGSLDTVKLKFVGKLAKFSNREEFNAEGAFGALEANGGFDEDGGMIMGSKMNDDDKAPF
jgi:replicative DNA helicase